MNLNNIKSSLVNLGILKYIDQKKTCSTKELLIVFDGKIVRRTLYSNLEKWDSHDKLIIRDSFDDKKAPNSHYTIKATPKLRFFFQNQFTSFLFSILGENMNLEVKDMNLQLMKDLENIHKDVSVPQILELLREIKSPDLARKILKILIKSIEMVLLKKIVSESMKHFKVPGEI